MPEISGVGRGGEGLLSRVLLRRYKLIIVCGFVCTVLMGAYLLFSPAKLKVSSRLYVKRNSPRLMVDQNDIMSDSKNYLSAQAELIKSMPIISEMLSNPDIVKGLHQSGVRDHVKFLREAIDVNVGLKDDLITISGVSASPIWMSNIINSMVDTYISYNSRLNNRTSYEVAQHLLREKSISEAELKAKQQKLIELARESGIVSEGSEVDNIELVKLAKMAEVLTEAEMEFTSIEILYKTVNSLSGQPDQIKAIALADGSYPGYIQEENALRLKLVELENRLGKLQQEATGQHPAVYATMEEIAGVRRQIAENTARLAKNYLDSIIQKWVICSRNVDEQKRLFEKQKSVAWALNSQATEYAILKSEIKSLEDTCSTFDQRIKEETVSASSDSMNVIILERADIISSVSATSYSKVLAIGLIAGLWLGLFLGFVRELTDKHVHSLEDVNEATRLPLLGIVPRLDSKDGFRRHGMVTQLEAASPASEAFREIWSALYFQGRRFNQRVIMITSPQQGEGKSVVASNLAITMAHSGAKVLLIDADLRRPSQHKIHSSSVARRSGLSNVLECGLDLLNDSISSTSILNLDLISSGPGTAIHCDLLAGDIFSNMLEVLRGNYDRIIIDAPPVLDVADARIMASVCDSTLVVVRADKSFRDHCSLATSMLTSLGADIAGVVVNDALNDKKRYGYYKSSYTYTASDN